MGPHIPGPNTPGPWQTRIDSKVRARFAPSHLELACESDKHGLPLTAEKHFRLVLVSAAFEGLMRIDRHRVVNEILADEIREHIHALSIQTFTPAEWDKKQVAFATPDCAHGTKR